MALESPFLTLVEDFELLAAMDHYTRVTAAVASRIEQQGLAGVLSMQFYLSEDGRDGGAVIRFAAASVFAEHVRTISGWPEVNEFVKLTRMKEIRAYGSVPAELEAWLQRVQGRVLRFPTFAAGFVRQG